MVYNGRCPVSGNVVLVGAIETEVKGRMSEAESVSSSSSARSSEFSGDSEGDVSMSMSVPSRRFSLSASSLYIEAGRRLR